MVFCFVFGSWHGLAPVGGLLNREGAGGSYDLLRQNIHEPRSQASLPSSRANPAQAAAADMRLRKRRLEPPQGQPLKIDPQEVCATQRCGSDHSDRRPTGRIRLILATTDHTRPGTNTERAPSAGGWILRKLLVRKGGLEPPHPYGHKNLNQLKFGLKDGQKDGTRSPVCF